MTKSNVNLDIKNEYGITERKKAEMIALLTNSALYHDEESNKYRIIPKQQLNKLIKKKYEENDYIGAEQLLENASPASREEYEKALKEIIAKSVRLPMADYINLLKKANKENISLADAARKNILLKARKKVNKLKLDGQIDKLKIDEILSKIDEWSSLKPSVNRERYELPWDYEKPDQKTKKSIDGVFKYLKSKDLDNAEGLYNFYEENFEVPFPDYEESMQEGNLNIYLVPKTGSKDISLQFKWDIWCGTKFGDQAQILLSLSKLSKNTINHVISEGWFREIFLSSINEADNISKLIPVIEEKLNHNIEDVDLYSIFGDDFHDYQIELEWPLTVENDIIFLDGIELTEDNIPLLQKAILKKLLEKEIIKIKPEVIKNKLVDMVDKDASPEEIKEIQKQLVIKQMGEVLASYSCDAIFSGIKKSQVITFTLPKVIIQVIEIFYDLSTIKAIISGGE